MSKTVSRRDALFSGVGVVAAIFGGRLVSEADFPGVLQLDTVYGAAIGRCGGTHVGDGVVVSAAHCLQGDGVTDIRFRGRPVERVDGKINAFVPASYERAGLEEDYGYIVDPYLIGKPAMPVATEAMYADLRARVRRGERPGALAVGFGTTRLDDLGRPTDVSDGLKAIDMEIIEATREKIVIRDPQGQGGSCVGDSGSGLLIDGHIYGVTSSVAQNPQTGWHCDTRGWTATYRSLESRLDELRAIRAAARKFYGEGV